jgi:hypothetical protein
VDNLNAANVLRLLVFFVGLVAGYVASGIVLGPGVLSVLIGIWVRAIAAWFIQPGSRTAR